MPFFTIAVPCCNVGRYLRDCLESIREQPFADWECLLVIEDSTDDTESIAGEFVAADARFRIIRQPRSGSAAMPRNTGIENATGEYLIFLDGDDAIAEDSLGRIARRIAENPGADLYACSILEYMDGAATRAELNSALRAGRTPPGFVRYIDNYLSSAPAELSGHDAILLLYRYWRNPSPMVQENIHRMAFLREHGLKFVPGLQHDDHEFSPREFYLAGRIVPIHEPFYLYRRQNASITMAAKKAPGHFLKYMVIVLRSLFAFHAEVSAAPDFDRRIAECWAREWIAWLFEWFYDWNVRRIPRQKRWETLSAVFADGFDDFDKLVKAAAFHRRVAVGWIRFFVRHPRLGWLPEALFRWYFRFAEARNRRSGSLHQHGEGA